MKRAVTLFAVIAALGLVFTGCKKKKKDEAKGGEDTMEAMDQAMDAMDMEAMDMEAMDMDAMDMEAMDMDAMDMEAMAAAGGDTLGIPECDEYIKIYRCYLSKVPSQAKAAAETAFKKTIETWKKSIEAAMGGPAKAAMAKGCKTAVDALKKAWKNNPFGKDCVK